MSIICEKNACIANKDDIKSYEKDYSTSRPKKIGYLIYIGKDEEEAIKAWEDEINLHTRNCGEDKDLSCKISYNDNIYEAMYYNRVRLIRYCKIEFFNKDIPWRTDALTVRKRSWTSSNLAWQRTSEKDLVVFENVNT